MFNTIELASKLGFFERKPIEFGNTKYNYVPLKTIYSKVLPLILKEGYDVEEGVELIGIHHRAFITFTHKETGKIFTHYGIPCNVDFTEYNKNNQPAFKQTMQNVGAMRTYLIRYAWNDLLHIEDYDLEKEVENEKKKEIADQQTIDNALKYIRATLTDKEIETKIEKSIDALSISDMPILQKIYRDEQKNIKEIK